MCLIQVPRHGWSNNSPFVICLKKFSVLPMWWFWAHLISFTLGGVVSVFSLVFAIVVFIHWLPCKQYLFGQHLADLHFYHEDNGNELTYFKFFLPKTMHTQDLLSNQRLPRLRRRRLGKISIRNSRKSAGCEYLPSR